MIGSDGYEYKDIAARLLNRPEDSPRNIEVSRLRHHKVCEEAIKAWAEEYDLYTTVFGATHDEAVSKARFAAILALSKSRPDISRDRIGRALARSAPAIGFCAADQPKIRRGVGARGHLSPA